MVPLEINAAAPLFIVLNGGSGSHDTAASHRIITDVLTHAGREHLVRVVDDPTQLRHIAQHTVEQACKYGGVVVAAGGDGTINTLAQATLGSGCVFGVLPQGTFNYFSRVHGIPADPTESTRLLLTARAHPVQVGLVNDHVFLVNASMGLYPQLLEDREAYKHHFGRSRLISFWSGLLTLLREHRQLHLFIEHHGQTRELHTPTLFVGNNRLQLEQLGIAEAAVMEAGLLVAITLRPVSTLSMLGLLVRGALGQLGEADSIMSFALRQITVNSGRRHATHRVKVATDGEIIWLQAPIQFRVSPEPLYLLKPEPDSAPEDSA